MFLCQSETILQSYFEALKNGKGTFLTRQISNKKRLRKSLKINGHIGFKLNLTKLLKMPQQKLENINIYIFINIFIFVTDDSQRKDTFNREHRHAVETGFIF